MKGSKNPIYLINYLVLRLRNEIQDVISLMESLGTKFRLIIQGIT